MFIIVKQILRLLGWGSGRFVPLENFSSRLYLNRSYLGMCSYCHPRESGDPENLPTFPDFLDSRFRGNDAGKLRIPRWLRLNKSFLYIYPFINTYNRI